MNTITLIVKTKYREIGFSSANLNSNIKVIDTNIPEIAIIPAFNPSISMSSRNTPSGVSGSTNSVNSTFCGSANFDILPAALIENKISRMMETPFAYFFNFGNFLLIPRASIAPCKRPIAKTTAKV